MLKLYPNLVFSDAPGITVYEDDSDPTMFYVLPSVPSFALNPVPGNPNNLSLKLIKYLAPVNNPDGSIGGGFLIFDSCFVTPTNVLNTIQGHLNQQINSGNKGNNPNQKDLVAKLAMPTFTAATATLTLLDSGGSLVTKIESAGKPSLTGSLLCSFTAVLSPTGVAVLEAAMEGSGGVAQIAYNLSYSAVLPPITGHVWFDGVKFAGFYQSIQKSGGSWDTSNNTENETMHEAFVNAQAGGVSFDFTGLNSSDPNTSKIEDDLTNWGWQQLNLAAQNALGSGQSASSSSGSSSTDGSGSSGTDGSSDASSGTGSGSSGSSGSGSTNAGVTGQNTGSDLGADRTSDGMDHVTRNESSWASFSFNETYTELQSVLFSTTQQGTLANPPNFKQYVTEINANDPFFAQLHATVSVDADFAKFQIDSVDVNMIYDQLNPPTVGGYHFVAADAGTTPYKFDSDTKNGNMTYKYTVTVNYQDQSAAYVAPQQSTTDLINTIDVGSMGMLYVNMTLYGIDFTKTPTVLVAIKYPDTDATGAAINRQLSFNSTTTSASLVVVLMKVFNKQYQYQITYVMADGTQLVRPWQSDTTSQLAITSPFSQQTVSFLSECDYVNDVNNIFLKMSYVDSANNYTQTTDYTFTSQNPSHDWSFATIAGSKGVIQYSGVIMHKSQTTDNIPLTTSTDSLITFGPPNQEIITVTPDPSLLDFTQVKLVQVNFTYSDPANNISLQQEFVIKPTGVTPASWTFYIKDKTKTAYTYQATYFMATTPPTQVQQGPTTSSDTDLILTMPSTAPSTAPSTT
jgi:hypothetical protein